MAREKKSAAPAPAPTTIRALGDDLLREVFLRLPSLPSLVRAALTCPAFLRAVRSSPAFRRRFRDLHPAPLLGFFLYIHNHVMPAFLPVRRRSDPDHAAAVRGADVFLTRVPLDEEEDEGQVEYADDPGWLMNGCRDGYVVLFYSLSHRAAVYDPLTRRPHLLSVPLEEIFGELPGETVVGLEFHVVTSEEDHRPLRVICICTEMGAPRVAVFSPDTREWQISSDAGSLQLPAGDSGTVVNGCVYWASAADIHVLNTATLHFSRIDPPPHMQDAGVKVGETSDGKLCVAWATGLMLKVWVRRAATAGVDEWMPDTEKWMLDAIDELELPFEYECPELEVVAIIGGIVYLSTYVASQPSSRWFLSFCTETEELEVVCPTSWRGLLFWYAIR
ncbi:uncharacterized protein [Aegilops tauschii subsp. strangulata]|uniref:uncharacterized protein n=1 Tax=Aegilops tauschii subsp. strangulata TaxID=200361 RepID=UPI000989E6AF|nr:uncharacterized protein LOC109748073 [Aegilops tauschii subsp. strangulata]